MKQHPISSVTAREIFDGRLEPTLRVRIDTETGITGIADVPRGRSRGKYEATDLRDEESSRLRGMGVQTAISRIEEEISPKLEGIPVTRQDVIDAITLEVDGTPQKSNLGGNSVTGVSLAALKAGADAIGQPIYRYIGGVGKVSLPIPLFDMIEGGELGGSGLPFQEHQVIPTGADTFSEAIRMGAEVYYEIGDIIQDKFGLNATNVGDEGGYAPADLTSAEEAFDIELDAIEELGYADKFGLGLDVAASHLYDPETELYDLGDTRLTPSDLKAYFENLVESYPVISIEDPLHQEDFSGFADLTNRLDIQIVGDDLFVTNIDRITRAVETGGGNCLLVKVNQVGTVSEGLEAASYARKHGYALQVSERSGQTPDTWLADFAVGIGANQIKTGVTRGERTAQFNRLLEIERNEPESTNGPWNSFSY